VRAESVSKAAFESEQQLIQALGGVTKVALALGLRKTAVSNWTMPERDGIPHRYHHQIVELAAQQNIEGVTHALLIALRREERAA